ncbi:corticotropin-releasing factor receptor 1-like isoform X2 [Pomacea canaliculata]|uniref:corticotropin-releasing factor receptor 1-like isoform X2 n=1 Tax=Pomacea canaliculata TaxID=400727 RepID=UPI000D73713A|nr:corticotropin-releasing factor receptor 1-like isoform X2 [Pomacea canaliculata]
MDVPNGSVTHANGPISVLGTGECAWPNQLLTETHCPAINDSLYCWPPTPANTTVFGPCPTSLGLPDHAIAGSAGHSHRTCSADGTWLHGNWTNYSACLDLDGLRPVFTPQPGLDLQDDFIRLAEALTEIYLAACIISLVFLLLTLFIFCYFRSLQCSRISIHKHLVVSFIFRFILILVMVLPYFSRPSASYREIPWLCKVLTALLQYTLMSNFAWMLVEGIYLHNRLAVCVFRSDAPFKIFNFIGWGIPFVLTCLWAGLMETFYTRPCWQLYSKSPFFCLIFVPILVALVINCAFLVNIIRVLVVKLRANNTIESRRIRKAIKATIILLPLLGMTNLLFLAQPAEQGPLLVAYRVINAVLPSCQGIFVSVLYCFMNSEVQSVIRKKWNRFRVNRAMNTRSRRQESNVRADQEYRCVRSDRHTVSLSLARVKSLRENRLLAHL